MAKRVPMRNFTLEDRLNSTMWAMPSPIHIQAYYEA